MYRANDNLPLVTQRFAPDEKVLNLVTTRPGDESSERVNDSGSEVFLGIHVVG